MYMQGEPIIICINQSRTEPNRRVEFVLEKEINTPRFCLALMMNGAEMCKFSYYKRCFLV